MPMQHKKHDKSWSALWVPNTLSNSVSVLQRTNGRNITWSWRFVQRFVQKNTREP